MVLRYENWHQPWCVIHGAGALDALPAELDRLGCERVLLLTTRSLVREGKLLASVRELVGERLAVEFGECDAHSPLPCVLKAAERARVGAVDGIVTFGGSTVTDTGKGVALALAENITTVAGFADYRVRSAPPAPPVKPALTADPVPVIALPTTLSGGEYTNVAGLVDPERGSKDLYSDDRLAMRTVILDPAQAAATPPELWSATGIKTMSDAVEQLYSKKAHPVTDALVVEAIGLLAGNLKASIDGDPDARLRCYIGSWMGLFSVFSSNALPGIGAALRHQVGAVSGAGHGQVTCVLLPHVLRFNLPAVPAVTRRLAEAFGVESAADPEAAVVAAVADLVASLGLPSALTELGVGPEHLEQIATHTMADFTGAGNPREVESTDQLVELLRAAG